MTRGWLDGGGVARWDGVGWLNGGGGRWGEWLDGVGVGWMGQGTAT